MTRAITGAAVLAVALALAPTAHAQSFYRCASQIEAELAIVHINGMLNSTDDAKQNLEELRPVAKRLGHDLVSYELDLAENHTGYLDDFKEVAVQAIGAHNAELIKQLTGLLPLPDALEKAFVDAAAAVELVGTINRGDLARQAQVVRDHLRKGQKVLLVAHSQGNFYANAVHTKLFVADDTPGEEAFRIVSVATPAPTVAGAQSPECPQGLCYATFYEDVVINGARALLPGFDALDPNVHLEAGRGAILDFELAHAFVGAYMADRNGRSLIEREMRAQLDGLTAEAPRAFDGVITASLEWDSAADLDLHVYEQDERSHVYWDRPTGLAGFLFPDSLNGLVEGENYAAECASLKPGRYDFDVDYYDGDGPATARLFLVVGQRYINVTRELDGPTAEPVPLASVDVVSFGDGQLGFTVARAPGTSQ
jgi:hypothetical protein